jgi:molecular chaperone GrpE
MQHNRSEQDNLGQQSSDTSIPSESWTDLEQKLTDEQQKAGEYLNLLQRTQADFINYRRRSTQEMSEGKTTAQMAMLGELLPVLDDLGRALASTPPELVNHPWVQGIALVSKRLTSTLEQMGIRRIGLPGEQFDPRVHEAVTVEPRADTPEGTIMHVLRQGYTLGERVIRPAQVVVAGAPSATRS